VAAMVWHRLSFLRALRPGVFEERAAALARFFRARASGESPIQISILHRLSEHPYVTYNNSIRFIHNTVYSNPSRPTALSDDVTRARVMTSASHARCALSAQLTARRHARGASMRPRRDRDARATTATRARGEDDGIVRRTRWRTRDGDRAARATRETATATARTRETRFANDARRARADRTTRGRGRARAGRREGSRDGAKTRTTRTKARGRRAMRDD